MAVNLYYLKKENKYYFAETDRHCDNCGKLITEMIIIRRMFDKLMSCVHYFCFKCGEAAKFSPHLSYQEILYACVVDSPPKKAFPVFHKTPQLTEGKNLSVFQAADTNIGGETAIDNTKLSNRESWEGAKIGHIPEEMKQLDENIPLDKADDIFNNIINAKPVIEKPELEQPAKKKMLEHETARHDNFQIK